MPADYFFGCAPSSTGIDRALALGQFVVGVRSLVHAVARIDRALTLGERVVDAGLAAGERVVDPRLEVGEADVRVRIARPPDRQGRPFARVRHVLTDLDGARVRAALGALDRDLGLALVAERIGEDGKAVVRHRPLGRGATALGALGLQRALVGANRLGVPGDLERLADGVDLYRHADPFC